MAQSGRLTTTTNCDALLICCCCDDGGTAGSTAETDCADGWKDVPQREWTMVSPKINIGACSVKVFFLKRIPVHIPR